MLKKIFIFSFSFSICALVWASADNESFGRFGWIISVMFSVLMTRLFGKSIKEAQLPS